MTNRRNRRAVREGTGVGLSIGVFTKVSKKLQECGERRPSPPCAARADGDALPVAPAVRVSNGRLAAVLGREPHTPLDEAVEATLEGLGCLAPIAADSDAATTASIAHEHAIKAIR